ncbi:MAG: ferrochelatase [Gammaproteobacteria bacterium]|nr:ferrochelatase [Gammaproteobacteria bacterium]
MKYLGKSEYNHTSPEKLGFLITNLGTPEAATPTALRKYLAEFLWDPRVVEFPRPLWWLVLNLVILRIRPRKSAATYAKIWTEQGSPLMVHTKSQLVALKEKFTAHNLEHIEVDFAMRYGKPSIESALIKMQENNVTQLLVLPLYPQYSGSTTGSTFDAVASTFAKLRWMPELRFVNQYPDDENYISACANQIQRYWATHEQSQVLLFSFHGLPKRYLLAGDPYHCQCYKTARLIAEKLQLNEEQWKLTFQSRFGREEWLQPYTDKTLEAMAKDNMESVDVFCPGFSADCVETLEEIDMLNREIFMQAGGEKFQYIPALNDNEDHVEAIYQLAVKHMQGWRGATSYDQEDDQQQKIVSQQRAKQLGAEQ